MKASRKVERHDEWFNYKHDANFPSVGTKVCFRSGFRKYLDANKKTANCSAGAPVWWTVEEDTEKTALAVVLRHKSKALRGEGQDICVLPADKCADEWKAIMKAPGKYLILNEQARFLKADKDGSVSLSQCNPDDPQMFKYFLWEVKTK